jgi:uncharacterized membrane protein
MKMMMKDVILFTAAMCTALIAGLFYAYSCSVNIALGKLADTEYIHAMQSINKEIQNPIFFLSFMGTLVLLPVSAWLSFDSQLSARFYFLAAAAIIYLFGVFGVTMMGNLPLNEALARFDAGKATTAQIAQYRLAFEKPWLFFHNIRTVLSVICLAAVLMSCLCGDINTPTPPK